MGQSVNMKDFGGRVAVLLIALVAAMAMAGMARAEDALNGLYQGVDDASGASIRITPDPGGFKGTFFDRHGNSQDFEADRVDNDAAEAVLDMDGQTVLLRMAPLPFGAQVSLIPFNPDGNLNLEFARALGFVRSDVNLPSRPANFVAPPRSDCQRIAMNSFLESYQFWDPAGVVNGYTCLAERHRTLMRMFPAVMLDVVWKLCLAPRSDIALGHALKNQDVDCAQVRAGIADAQRLGRFDRYKALVEGERTSLLTSVRCADVYAESRETCERAGKVLSQKAISLETVGSVLSQIR